MAKIIRETNWKPPKKHLDILNWLSRGIDKSIENNWEGGWQKKYLLEYMEELLWKVKSEDEEMLKKHYELYDKNKKKDPFYKFASKHLKAWLKH